MPYKVPNITDFRHLSERQKDPVLIYLPASQPSLKSVLKAVTQLDLPCHAYISNVPMEKVTKLAGPKVVFHRKPLVFEQVLLTSRLIIHHAGLATSYAALKAGTPQLVITKNLEHSITAKDLLKLGVAIKDRASAKPEPERIMSHIDQLLRDEAIWDAAFRAATESARQPEQQSLEAVVEACQQLLDQ
jgi:UDP:flavonoid glycosyltransferase YjiC (YdhE family)